MIVKVQKPLLGNDVLIYNRSRSVQILVPYTREWKKWFAGHLKRYAKAHLEGTELVIDKIAEDRNW